MIKARCSCYAGFPYTRGPIWSGKGHGNSRNSLRLQPLQSANAVGLLFLFNELMPLYCFFDPLLDLMLVRNRKRAIHWHISFSVKLLLSSYVLSPWMCRKISTYIQSNLPPRVLASSGTVREANMVCIVNMRDTRTLLLVLKAQCMKYLFWSSTFEIFITRHPQGLLHS